MKLSGEYNKYSQGKLQRLSARKWFCLLQQYGEANTECISEYIGPGEIITDNNTSYPGMFKPQQFYQIKILQGLYQV